MTTFRSELAEPYDIDWTNPDTDGLVGLFVLVDGMVVDLVSGTSTAVTNTIGDAWNETVTFSMDDLSFDVNDGANYSIIAMASNWSVSDLGSSSAAFRFADDVASNYIDFNEDTAYTTTKASFGGNYLEGAAPDTAPITNGRDTIGINFNFSLATKTYINWSLFANNILVNAIQGQSGFLTRRDKLILYTKKYEMFAVYTNHRTLEQFQSIKADPYSLIKTFTDTKQEYYLQNPNPQVTNAQITYDNISAAAGEDFTLELEYRREITGSSHLIVGSTSSNYIFFQNGIRIKLGGADGSTVDLGADLGVWYNLKIVRIGSSLIAYLDGVEVYNEIDSTGLVLLNKALYGDIYASTASIKLIKFIVPTTPTNSRYWTFNKTKGDTVTDHINGAVATLVNFPVDSGYVRGVDGNVGGYQLGTDIITVTLSGAYSGIITYMDGSTLDVSGSGNYVFDIAHILPVKEFNVTDTLSTYHYDFTTGDKDQIIETISNNHATITSASTSKWQPVVIKDIFTIGTGKDYPSPQEFKDARKSVLTVQVGVLYEMFDSSLFQYGYFWGSGWRAQNEFIAAKGMEYNGNSLDPNNVGWKDFNSVGSKCFGSGSINATGLVFGSIDTAGEGQLVNSYASGVDVQSIGTLRLRDSCVTFSGGAFQSGTVNATNSIISGRFNDNDDGSTMNADSCVFPTAIYGNTVNTFNAKNSQFAGTNEYIDTDGGGNEFSIDMSTWFVDEANKDFTVTASGQTALAGKGFNNSNIAQWAYLAIAVLIEGSLTSNTTQSVVVQGIKVTAGALEGTLTITISSDSTSTGAKLASAELIETVVLTYNIQALKAAAGTSISNIPSASTILGYKAAAGTSISSIGSNYSTDGLKGATGDVTNTLTFTNTETGKKIMSEVIQVMNTITSDTAAIKVGISSLEESLSAAIPLQGVKNTSGTAISDVIHSISIIGQKIVVGVAQGFIEIDLVSGTNTTGTKGTSGVISTELNMGIILETLKLMEGSLQEAVSSETLTEGIKNTSGLTISAHTIIDTLSAYKSAGNILPIITNNSIVETEGTKGSTGTLVELGTILVELEALASKSGDIELAHEIADLIVGVNTDTTHIQRLNVVLGTLNIRYSPISGIVSSKSIQGVV